MPTSRSADGPGSAMTVHVRMRLSGRSDLDGKAGTRRTVFSFVVRKSEAGWLCVSARNTDIVSGAETYIRTESGELVPADHRKK